MAGNPGLNADLYSAELLAGTGIHLQTSVTADGNAAEGSLFALPGREMRDTTKIAGMHPRVDISRHHLIPAPLHVGHGVYAHQAWPSGNDLRLGPEQALLDLGVGLTWLSTLGFRRLVGLGNSGGGGWEWRDLAAGAQLDRTDAIARTHVEEAAAARVKAGTTDRADRDRAGTTRLITVWPADAALWAMDLGLNKSDRVLRLGLRLRTEVGNHGIVGFGRLRTPDAWLSTWSAHASNAKIAKAGPEMALLPTCTTDNCVFPSDCEEIVDAVGSTEGRQRIRDRSLRQPGRRRKARCRRRPDLPVGPTCLSTGGLRMSQPQVPSQSREATS